MLGGCPLQSPTISLHARSREAHQDVAVSDCVEEVVLLGAAHAGDDDHLAHACSQEGGGRKAGVCSYRAGVGRCEVCGEWEPGQHAAPPHNPPAALAASICAFWPSQSICGHRGTVNDGEKQADVRPGPLHPPQLRTSTAAAHINRQGWPHCWLVRTSCGQAGLPMPGARCPAWLTTLPQPSPAAAAGGGSSHTAPRRAPAPASGPP